MFKHLSIHWSRLEWTYGTKYQIDLKVTPELTLEGTTRSPRLIMLRRSISQSRFEKIDYRFSQFDVLRKWLAE